MKSRQHAGSALVSALVIMLAVMLLTGMVLPQMMRWRQQYRIQDRNSAQLLRQWHEPQRSANKVATSTPK